MLRCPAAQRRFRNIRRIGEKERNKQMVKTWNVSAETKALAPDIGCLPVCVPVNVLARPCAQHTRRMRDAPAPTLVSNTAATWSECDAGKNLPVTIHSTIPLPAMATNIIRPNTMAQIVFCSQGNSYGRVGEGNKHSVRKSLDSARGREIYWKIYLCPMCIYSNYFKYPIASHSKNKYVEIFWTLLFVFLSVVVVVLCTNQFTLQWVT